MALFDDKVAILLLSLPLVEIIDCDDIADICCEFGGEIAAVALKPSLAATPFGVPFAGEAMFAKMTYVYICSFGVYIYLG